MDGPSMSSGQVYFAQSNLQHSKGTTALLNRDLAVRKTCIALIQEPWVTMSKIQGLNIKGNELRNDLNSPVPRACIVVKRELGAVRLNEFCPRDVVAAVIKLKLRGRFRSVAICSAYLPSDSADPPPCRKLTELVEFCLANNTLLVIGSDANAHHTIWGSSNTNKRGMAVLNFVTANNLEILNMGSRPTFVTSRSQDVIDVTLSEISLASLIVNWRLDEEYSLSDHRRILFELHLEETQVENKQSRNPRATNWDLYSKILEEELRKRHVRPWTANSAERQAETLHHAIKKAYEGACPAVNRAGSTRCKWWNAKLEGLWKESRKRSNRAWETGLETDWNTYRGTLREYKRLIKESKRIKWREFCEKTENLPLVAKLKKEFTTGPTQGLRQHSSTQWEEQLTRSKSCDTSLTLTSRTLRDLIRVRWRRKQSLTATESGPDGRSPTR
uniref:Endonuclease/exonuclease/phosphatase domain-containing protein n=1 Tax=Bracon brevicornis TaxID=1563983 RepID=A0A6V7LXU7_9HYME